MKTINLPPNASVLMESTRSIGYSLESAVADIIDNSISANAKKMFIGYFPIGEPHIYILDDGDGMDSDQLNNAMQYGSKSPYEKRNEYDLGRYGLGLKTASLSQCRELTVISKQENEIFGRRWDLDYIKESNQWSLIDLQSEEMIDLPGFNELEKLNSGTLVIWRKLDKIIIGDSSFESKFSAKLDFVNEHLSLVFHRFLDNDSSVKNIEIYSNNAKILPQDPFLMKKSTLIMDAEIIRIENENVIVKPYLLPHLSKMTNAELEKVGGKDGLRSNQGFYVYRNKRLLVWGTWFRMLPKHDISKLARIMIDIPNTLDHLWTLDIKKSTAIPPEDIRKNLVGIITKMAESSKRTFLTRGKKETKETITHFWDRITNRDKSINYTINRNHPIIKLFCANHGIDKNEIDRFLSYIESNIPLNQMYLDMTNDNSLISEKNQNRDDILKLFDSIIESINPSEIIVFVNEMINVEPFSELRYEILDKYSKEVKE
jgi:hypothetical protein